MSKKNTINLKEQLKLQWPRLLLSLKSMVIIGVGSIFVLAPRLAAAFENGQWILVTLCAIWAYVTYLSVHDNVYQTLGMLSPWIFVFSYLKLLPIWGYTATVAAFTSVLINLESLLKDNIQSTLTICRQSIISMHSIYDQLFHHNHSRESIIRLELEQQKIESFIDVQRSCFHHLISLQRTLVEHASLEPTFWWINNNFSTKYYNVLIQQQINIFKMLHNIDATLMRINEYSQRIEHLQLDAADGHFPPNLHRGFSDLSRQLNDCFHLSISYFALSQTQFHQLFRQCIYSRTKLNETDLTKHEQHLIDLYQMIHRLQIQHEEELNRLLTYYLECLTESESYSTFVPCINSDEANSIFIAYYAMYYSTTQLTQSALTLGETIHTIFELETTHLYRLF
ncbi:unnamed protein product [Rotaria sordida]|uniref:Uncharacterized protein n=1 Tax=Rotaria sordida TaxID=392033 RepID=A0A814W9H8_9BILA|nr:unnamed protein product [Rotaria sordida]